MSDVWKWLCLIHRTSEAEMEESVKALCMKGLLNKVSRVDELEIRIHDLYLDFAEVEARAGPINKRRFLLDKKGTAVPHELLKKPPGLCWPLERFIIHKSKVQSLKKANLQLCSNVEVLELYCCEELEEVDIGGMDILRSLEVVECDKLGQNIEGVEKLRNLGWFRWLNHDFSPAPKFLNDLFLMTALEVLHLRGLDWSEVSFFPPNLSRCMNLREVALCNFRDSDMARSTTGLPDFGNLPKSLLKIDFSECHGLVGSSPIGSMSSLTNLQDLNLEMCENISDLSGLSKLISLLNLNIRGTDISELPDLRNLEQLQFLNLSSCKKLSSLVGIAHATALRHVIASHCKNLRELPDDFSSLKMLEMVDLSWDEFICILPNDYERLAGQSILKVKGCSGLVVPLVNELQHRKPTERSHADCVNSIGCVASCKQSMQSWINASKDVSRATYHLLKDVVSRYGTHMPNSSYLSYGSKPSYCSFWSYLLDDGSDRYDFFVRALCEHDDRGGNERLSSVLAEVTVHARTWSCCWMVVMTAPCTFGVVTERPKLEPWGETLLHYTIAMILPQFLALRKEGGAGTWTELGMGTLLQKCKEKLQEASDCGIDPVRSVEGKEVADSFFKEIETTSGQRRGAGSSILLDIDENGSSYSQIFPNFPFGPTLATQSLLPHEDLYPVTFMLGQEYNRYYYY